MDKIIRHESGSSQRSLECYLESVGDVESLEEGRNAKRNWSIRIGSKVYVIFCKNKRKRIGVT